MEQIRYIEEVLELLKDGETVLGKEGSDVVYFSFRKGKVVVRGNNYTIHLPVTEWQELYGERLFYLVPQEDDDLIDPEKDKEYYSWRHK